MTIRQIAKYADLHGKSVFISGGGSGIGADLVRAFHTQGAATFFVDIDRSASDALCEELKKETGSSPDFQVCDVTDLESLAAALDRIADLTGRLDVLVNNAANDTRYLSAEVDEANFDASIAVNLKHQFFAATRAFAHMRRRGSGSIINFGSVAPRLGIRNLAVYSTCKSAVQGLTRSLAREFGEFGVRVNAIVPGAIMTERQRQLWITEEIEKENQKAQCLPRTLVADDIAQMALFLASDVSWGCTSQNFIVDAGITG
ncbi:SDR family oxidoreductase [Rhodospirillaceae bacterium KN72]|uniref:SDR family oxidoreductase n=1 Tax=Pacificispira spongiicola TaxID=2729598 RepID=A0A7Y0DWW2_9PROT|nr:SDR family oxidoreductase [Pacificispira spongiicola]NMM43077.1 SDR family oxidoreductase [Pacificispira spongiicola]